MSDTGHNAKVHPTIQASIDRMNSKSDSATLATRNDVVDNKKSTNLKDKITTKGHGSSSAYSNGGYGYYEFSKCRHKQVPITIGNYVVHANGSTAWRIKDIYPPKDLALYLDVGTWMAIRGMLPIPTTRKVRIAVQEDNWGKFAYVPWQDYHDIPKDRFRRLIGVD